MEKTKQPHAFMPLLLKIAIGVVTLAVVGFLVYSYQDAAFVTNLISKAASQNCSITKSGSSYYIDGIACKFPNQSYTCGNVDYCCPGVGQKWKVCSSAVITQPTKTGTTTTTGGVKKVQRNTPIYPGEKVCPPQQKKGVKPGSTKTNPTTGKQSCNDYNCQNIKQDNNWGIINCDTGDSDGDMQLCQKQGRIGICGGTKMCCPGPGQKWTTDMANCPVTAASASLAPANVSANSTMTLSYSNIPAPSTSDWFGIYETAETDERAPIEWNYLTSSGSCSKSQGSGSASGSCTFTVPSTIPSGTYEVRVFSSDTFAKVAKTNAVSITGTTPTTTPSNTPSHTPSHTPTKTPTQTPTGAITITPTRTPTPTVSGTITPTRTPTPSGTCCACPTPTPRYTISACNGSCMANGNCANGQICLLISGTGWVCRNPACAENSSCSCSTTSTPTQTPTVTPSITVTPTSPSTRAVCNEVCTSSSQCKVGYQCVYINNSTTAICRNTRCPLSNTCTCPARYYTGGTAITLTPGVTGVGSWGTGTPTPTFCTKGTENCPTFTPTPSTSATISATPMATVSATLTPSVKITMTPTMTLTPTPTPMDPVLTIKSFTDSSGKTDPKFTLAGTSDPYAEITVRIEPDSVGQTTTADSKGEWRYILTKSLSAGNKELTVTARTNEGGETQVKQSFTAKSKSNFGSLFLGFLFIALLGGVGFFIYQRQMNDQSNLFSQFPPIQSEPEPPVQTEPIQPASTNEPAPTQEIQPVQTEDQSSTTVFEPQEGPKDNYS